MATKIKPISKTKTIDYGNELLQNFWRQKSNIPANQNHRKQISDILKSVQEGVVCIQSEILTDKEIIKQIFDSAKNLNVRFYILVNEYSQELDVLNEICLIRYEVKNKGSFVLVNPSSNKLSGMFFSGQFTEQNIAETQRISRSLEEQEIEELYRHFCFHFWETAQKERLEKGKENNVTSKPLDIFHNANAFDGKDFVYGTLFDFVEITKRSEMSDKQLISVNQETKIPTLINPKRIIEIGENIAEILLPKNEFEVQEPNFTDDKVSINIEFIWQNVPFYLPEKASENSLYERWKKKNEEIIKQLDSILQKIETAEKKEASLSKALSRFFLGKKKVFSSLKNEIGDLKQGDFANQSEAKLKEKINRINEINAQVQNEIGEIENENRKAKLDEEIESFKIEISTKEIELKTKQDELEAKKQDEEQRKFVSKTQGEIKE
jgi:hypothetical protein